MDESVTIEKEMGITPDEFLRVMARALDGRAHRTEGNTIRIEDGGRLLRISLQPQTQRRIGLFTLPVARVCLEFHGYGDPEIAETMAWFDRSFQRGGG